jgi:hypothetical protein
MAKRGRAWKLERTVVHRKGAPPRSNRYRPGEGPRPAAGSRQFYWHPGNNRYQRNPYYRGR